MGGVKQICFQGERPKKNWGKLLFFFFSFFLLLGVQQKCDRVVKNRMFLKKKRKRMHFCFIVWSQANIRNTFFDQSSPQHRDVGVLEGGPKPRVLTISEKNKHTFFYCVIAGHIRNRFFDQSSPRYWEVGVSRCHEHTDIQTDMATLWLIRPSAVGWFSENLAYGINWISGCGTTILKTEKKKRKYQT